MAKICADDKKVFRNPRKRYMQRIENPEKGMYPLVSKSNKVQDRSRDENEMKHRRNPT